MSIRYSEIIPLNIATVAALRDDTDAGKLLRKDIESYPGKIVSVLRAYQQLKDAGSGKIYTFNIISDITVDKDGSGSFEVKFPVRVSYGCRELIEWVEEKMVLHLQVDFADFSASITGAEIVAP